MSLALATKEKLIGKAVRKIPSETNVYLSFDDGPDPVFTPKVLEVLKRHNAQATFFVIGQKAVAQLDLIKKSSAMDTASETIHSIIVTVFFLKGKDVCMSG
jgi:peptidoglycan/xylan/chitin deacetylase (PgdA/CDA1 family)